MRIITGAYRGAKLFTVPGRTTRPTTSYHREMIFSMQSDYAGKTVLDLFAGTGSFGLETLSRGALWVDFVEFASAAISVLMQNIHKLKCEESCHVWRKRAEAFVKAPPRTYDVIFLDPPYNKGLVNPVLEGIYQGGLLLPDGVIIAEHSPKEPLLPEFVSDRIAGRENRESCFSILCPQAKSPLARDLHVSQEID